MNITGGCHCGNISFTLDWQGESSEIPARSCGCTFCVKHAGVWTSQPGATLHVRVTDTGAVSRYAFDNVERARLRAMPASFEGEEVGARFERRKRNWIANVVMSG